MSYVLSRSPRTIRLRVLVLLPSLLLIRYPLATYFCLFPRRSDVLATQLPGQSIEISQPSMPSNNRSGSNSLVRRGRVLCEIPDIIAEEDGIAVSVDESYGAWKGVVVFEHVVEI